MKKILIAALLIVSAFALFFSCVDEGIPDNAATVEAVAMNLKSVTVYRDTQHKRKGTISEFAEGDSIGLFLPDNPLWYLSLFADYHLHEWWQISMPLLLTGQPTRLLAYYPYRQKEHGHLVDRYVNVEHVSQTDYMHGKVLGEWLNRKMPDAYILMKHVLALVQFRFIRNGYPHDCSIQKIAIRNGDGVEHLHSRGRLNLEMGVLEPLEEYYEEACILPDNMGFSSPPVNEKDYPRLLVFPMDPTIADGELVIEIQIDGHSYRHLVRKGTSWEAGMKYTYEVEMYPDNRSTKSSAASGDIRVVLTQISQR